MAATLKQFEIFIGEDKQWYWRLIGPNGQIVAVAGEGFRRRAGAVNSCKKLHEWSDTTVIRIVTEVK